MFAVQKYLPAAGVALEVYPHPDQPEQWVVRLSTLDGKAEGTRYWKHTAANLLPPGGLRLQARPDAETNKWKFHYRAYDGSDEIYKEVEPNANLLKVLGSMFKTPVIGALTPIVLELNNAIKTKLRDMGL